MIEATTEEINFLKKNGGSEEDVTVLQSLQWNSVYKYSAGKERELGDRIDGIIKREEGDIQMTKENKKSSGWFGKLSRFVTLSDPYAVDMKNSSQKVSTLRYLQTSTGKELREELRKNPEDIDLNMVQEKIAILERSIARANQVDTDSSHFQLEEEALDVTRDLSIAAVTLPTAFVGGTAAAGYTGAMKVGAWQGGKLAFLSSGAANTEEVTSGDKTAYEGVRDTGVDTVAGTSFGAVGGAVFLKGQNMIGNFITKLRKPPRVSTSNSAPNASAKQNPNKRPNSGSQKAPNQQANRSNPNKRPNQKAPDRQAKNSQSKQEAPKKNTSQNRRKTPEEAERAQARGAERALRKKLARVPQAWDDLGVPKNSTQEVVKKAYKDLSKKFHPDRNPNSPDAVDNFKKVNEAYEALKAYFDQAA